MQILHKLSPKFTLNINSTNKRLDLWNTPKKRKEKREDYYNNNISGVKENQCILNLIACNCIWPQQKNHPIHQNVLC